MLNSLAAKNSPEASGSKKTSGLARDVLTLAAGTASAQMIGIVTVPIIARLFSPAAFGALAVFAAASGPVSIIACLRYELAIVLPEKDQDASHLVWLCLLSLAVTIALVTVVLVLTGDRIWNTLNVAVLRPYSWLIPVNICVTGVNSILLSWNTRKKQFRRLMTIQIVTRVAITAAQVAGAIAGFAGAGGLIATTVLGTLIATVVLGTQTWRNEARIFLSGISPRRVRSLMRRYGLFPKYSVGATFLNSISQTLPAALLSTYFSLATAGQFSLGSRLLRVPGSLIGSNFSRAFFPRATEARAEGTLGNCVETSLIYLLKLTAFPCVLLALTGKDLFLVFLGSQWAEAGVYSQILSVWLLTWFMSSPLDNVFVVLEEQGLELRFQIANVLARFVSLFIGGLLGNARLAVGCFAAAGVLVYGSYSAAVMIKTHARLLVILKPLVSTFVFMLVAAVMLEFVKLFTNSRLAVLGIAALLLVAYFSNLFLTDPAARQLLASFRQKLSPAV